MRDRLIAVMQSDFADPPVTDWASGVIANLMQWVTSNDPIALDAIQFIFDVVDGPPAQGTAG